ncbi:ATP-binding cassette domain-containing protein [bacterium]|nr:ATP-binding cassette domain-containing protein [bacterium]
MERVLFENVWKLYDRRYGSNRFRRSWQALMGRHPERHEFWALRDVSFRLEEGRSLGIIGPNGSGKTTTLRILSGISHIDRGHVRVRGTLSALIALGAGFHPELSGRENIYLNGAILGLKHSEIRRYFDDIVDFAGIGEYIDSPVKRYSSGMYVRLGFAVAAQIRPDVLLVDEVLAVGDARFQARCHERIRELRDQGTVIILVSHDMWAVRQSCAEGILIRQGRIEEQGDIATVLEAYNRVVQQESLERLTRHREESATAGVSCDLNILNERGETSGEIGLGHPVTFRIRYRADEVIRRPTLVLTASAHTGPCALVLRSRKAGWSVDRLEGNGHVDVTVDEMRLNPGRYAAQCVIKDEHDLTALATSPFRELYVRPPQLDWIKEDCFYVPEAKWSEPRTDQFQIP